MKKYLKYVIGILAILIAGFIYYYVTLPAINIHSSGFWFFLMVLLVIALFAAAFVKIKKHGKAVEIQSLAELTVVKDSKLVKLILVLMGVVIVVFIGGSILSSPIVNAKKYQKLLTVESRNFTEDIKEVDYNTIPLLDKDSAALLGDRKMGSLVDMASQFEVSYNYTQINYKNEPVRISPLVYANGIKWLTNMRQGIPAYMKIDMATQDTECVKLEQGIRYSESEYFNRNIYRHLRFNYPTYIFDQIFFEIDDEGTPYWVAPVKKFNIGLFGGQTIAQVVLCNAITGETIDYEVEDVPQWVDKVYNAELLMTLFNYYGSLKHGFLNSVLGQKDCLQTTNGYNYIALEDDVWVYTGITSVSGDQSNVGFLLMNQRTMETRYYQIEGAVEASAMSSAEGQVQNLGYKATFPLLLNIANEPTYFIALKDNAGLVKKYAMVNVQKYQWVAIGDTVAECEKSYLKLLNTNGITNVSAENHQVVGLIEKISPIDIDGNTHYFIKLRNDKNLYDINVSEFIPVLYYNVGDSIKFSYNTEPGVNVVTEIVQ